jgi:hypothetical protein
VREKGRVDDETILPIHLKILKRQVAMLVTKVKKNENENKIPK